MTERYKGRLLFGSIPVDNDLSLTTPSSRPTSIKELVPGLKERDDDTGMFFYNANQQNESYVSRRPQSDSLLNQCRSQGGCDPRINAWNEFVATLKASRLNPMSKVEAVNVWVNESIRYDYNKKMVVHGKDWDQTPFTTLSSGRGVCSDIARLKYETLKSIGAVADSNMRLVGGLMYDQQGKILDQHEILVVNVDNKNWVLNNNLSGDRPSVRPLLHGGVEQADVYVSGKPGGSAISQRQRSLGR
jgi:predicted transglutaminase-like cysteine proteinase